MVYTANNWTPRCCFLYLQLWRQHLNTKQLYTKDRRSAIGIRDRRSSQKVAGLHLDIKSKDRDFFDPMLDRFQNWLHSVFAHIGSV